MPPVVKNTKNDKPGPLRVAVYGDMGVGKTTFAGTFPKPFFFSVGAESGISSLSQLDNASDYTLINTPEEMLEAAKYFKAEYKTKGWRTAVIDTATVYGRMISMLESGYGTRAMEWTNWTKVLGHFLNLRDTIHSCDVHAVWVLHVDDIKSGDIVLRRAPKLIGQALREILQTVGLLGYLSKEETQEKRDDGGNVIQPAQTVRRFWVRCPQGLPPPLDIMFETKNWYEGVLTAICYYPSFATLAKFLAPKEGRQHITV